MNKYFLGFITVIAVAAVGAAIYAVLWQHTEQRDELPGESDTLDVAASFYVLAHFAEQVGGDAVSVTSVMPAGVDPHTYEPSPRDVASIQDADVFLYQGANFNPTMQRIAGGLPEHVYTVEMTAHFDLLDSGCDHHDHHHDGHSHHHDHHDDDHADHVHIKDPHIWLDPIRAQRMVDIIADTFSTLDPANASLYHRNAERYKEELDVLHADFETTLSHCELSTIIVSHNAFSYLADRYNFKIVPISGVSPDMEPSPKRLAEITDIVRKEGVDVIFFEHLITPRLADTIARETGTRTLVLDPIGGLTSEGEKRGDTYISIQRNNMNNLNEALRCQEK
jgi:zinc transport system substrate-binding protein